jgi:hypothetical protein
LAYRRDKLGVVAGDLEPTGGFFVTVVLLLGVALLAGIVVMGARRRSEVLAWERELDAAFGAGDRTEISRRRVL